MQWIHYRNETGDQAGFVLTPNIMSVCEQVGKHARSKNSPPDSGAGKELTALSMEEPITSSQLEGANTTTLVARDMLESSRAPRTEDEHMIAGNARLMAEIPDLLQEPLTPDLIRRFHAVGMGGINDEKYRPGEFRDTDDVVIADYDGNIVHQPPAATDLQVRLQMVCDFVNDTGSYVHPLVKACVLHFMIAHEHPFRDGNERTSRGLFYWYMLKSEYDVFKYISISQLLHAAPAKYAHSYQYTETDDMDLSYYLEYQASIIHRAMTRLLQYVDDLVARAARIDHFLYKSGSLSRLSGRQVTLLNIILAEPGKKYSAAGVAEALGVSDNKARNDLRTLVRENLLTEISENDQKTVFKVSRDLS
nr:Fic family protein [Salmonella enterica]